MRRTALQKLASARNLDDCKKARMSVHFVVSRADTLQFSYDSCMIPLKPKDKGKSLEAARGVRATL